MVVVGGGVVVGIVVGKVVTVDDDVAAEVGVVAVVMVVAAAGATKPGIAFVCIGNGLHFFLLLLPPQLTISAVAVTDSTMSSIQNEATAITTTSSTSVDRFSHTIKLKQIRFNLYQT